MALIGSIGESWSAYIEWLEQVFLANDKEGKAFCDRGLSVMGAITYGLLRNLIQPKKPKDKSYNYTVVIIKSHFEPKSLPIVERFHLNHCNKKADKLVMEYAAELKQFAVSHEFGATLDEALHDCFLCGICNKA